MTTPSNEQLFSIFTAIYSAMENIVQRLNDLDKRVTDVEDDLSDVEDEHADRHVALLEDINNTFAQISDDMNEVEARLEGVDEDLNALFTAVPEAEDYVGNGETCGDLGDFIMDIAPTETPFNREITFGPEDTDETIEAKLNEVFGDVDDFGAEPEEDECDCQFCQNHRSSLEG